MISSFSTSVSKSVSVAVSPSVAVGVDIMSAGSASTGGVATAEAIVLEPAVPLQEDAAFERGPVGNNGVRFAIAFFWPYILSMSRNG